MTEALRYSEDSCSPEAEASISPRSSAEKCEDTRVDVMARDFGRELGETARPRVRYKLVYEGGIVERRAIPVE